MASIHSFPTVTQGDTSIQPPTKDELLSQIAEALAGVSQYITHGAVLLSFDKLPSDLQGHVRYVARAAINSCDRSKIHDARLRARQALALTRYGMEFHLLTVSQQRAVYHEAFEACSAYQAALEGVSSPLHPEERQQLEVPMGRLLASVGEVGDGNDSNR